VAAFFRLIRLSNLLLLAVSLLAAYWLLVGNCALSPFAVAGWVMAVVCTAAGGYAINDCADLTIDRINKPQRPLPAGKLSVRQAVAIATALFISGLLFSLMNQWLLWLTIGSALALIAYAQKLKCMPLIGNLTVALLSAAAFFSLRLLCSKVDNALYELVVFAGLTHFLREQVKCLEDAEGDRLANCRTLPVALGMPAAKKVALATAFLIITACGAVAAMKEGLIIVAWLFLSALFCIFAWQLQSAQAVNHFAGLATRLKLLMIVGMAVVLCGAVYQ
jgi:4-hydroxybenzoate polyprenyltransferase